MKPLVVVVGLAITAAGCASLLDIEKGVYAGGEDNVPGDPDVATLARLRLGLRGYWRFEGDGRDSADGGFDLATTKPELPATFDAGKLGAGWLPGLAESDECRGCNVFEYADASALQIERDFTISIWVRPDANPAADAWFEYGIFDNDQVRIVGEAFNVSPAPCHPTLLLLKNGTPIYTVRDSLFDFRSASNRGRWNHVVAYRKDTTLGLRINRYLTTTTQTSPGGEGPAGKLRVGGAAGAPSWQGGVDELGIWDRALETDEIDALYNLGRGAALFE